jgi:hypothetical protein
LRSEILPRYHYLYRDFFQSHTGGKYGASSQGAIAGSLLQFVVVVLRPHSVESAEKRNCLSVISLRDYQKPPFSGPFLCGPMSRTPILRNLLIS